MTDEHEDREDDEQHTARVAHPTPVAHPSPSAPPTEAIILKSSD